MGGLQSRVPDEGRKQDDRRRESGLRVRAQLAWIPRLPFLVPLPCGNQGKALHVRGKRCEVGGADSSLWLDTGVQGKLGGLSCASPGREGGGI